MWSDKSADRALKRRLVSVPSDRAFVKRLTSKRQLTVCPVMKHPRAQNKSSDVQSDDAEQHLWPCECQKGEEDDREPTIPGRCQGIEHEGEKQETSEDELVQGKGHDAITLTKCREGDARRCP